MKKLLALLLAIIVFCTVFVGCGNNKKDSEEDVFYPEETPAPVEPRYPEIGDTTLKLYYDDHLSVEQLGTGEVEITQQTPTSYAVGTQSLDSAVLTYLKEEKQLIATGVGTATLTVGQKSYAVTVEAAPINLMMITGHSIGAGETGEPGASIVCPAGTAYSSFGRDLTGTYAKDMGIGYAAQKRPNNIDAFVPGGGGTKGEGPGLAYKWYELTGEKIWVLNTAVGGSCLVNWLQGTGNYNTAVNAFNYAQKVIANEVAAGHYRMKDKILIYHSGTNFTYNNVEYTQKEAEEWYASMLDGFEKDLAVDIDGDGQAETFDALGFVPIWGKKENINYVADKGANYFMGASDAYGKLFLSSDISRNWNSNDKVVATLPKMEYETHRLEITWPTTVDEIYSDGTHYQQVAYTALGMDIAQNIFNYMRTVEKPTSLELYNAEGELLADEITLKAGEKLEIVPVVKPITVNDLTFKVEGNLKSEFPFLLKGTEKGKGTLTVSYRGEVLKTVEFTITK